ncbi:MAG: hypothetical protein RLZZ367_365, partial [Bacteroidota bacterium]
YFNMRHSPQVINFVWLYLLNQADNIGRVAKIAVMQKKITVALVWVFVQMVDTARVE